MAVCSHCGNDYDWTFQVSRDGQTYTFDSIECAAHVIAPKCEHCGCQILGHGVQAGEQIFCCAHCARQRGIAGLESSVAAGGTTGAQG